MQIETQKVQSRSIRQKVITAVLALLLALFCTVGYLTDHSFSLSFPLPLLIVCTAILAAVGYFVLQWLWGFLDKISARKKGHRKSIGIVSFVNSHADSRVFWLCVQALLLLLWMPVWLAAWPGFYCYDTETLQSFNEGVYNSEHPLLYTVVASRIMFGIGSLAGDFNVGVAVYIAMTAIIVSSILVYALKFIVKEGHPVLAIIGFVFYACDPIVVMFSLCSAKDVMSSSAVVALFIVVYRVVRSPELLDTWRCRITLVLLFSLLSMLRNNSIVALVIFAPVLLWACWEKRRAVLACFGATAVVLALWFGVVTNVITSSYERTESFTFLLVNSVPEQQLAYAWNDGNLDEEEIADFQAVITPGSEMLLNGVKYDDADASRGAFSDVLIYKRDLGAFYRLYIKEGLKHPGAYTRAVLGLTYEAWYPLSTPRGYNGGWNTSFDYDVCTTSLFACSVEEPAALDSKIPPLYDFLWWISRYDVLQTNPFTAWLISIPFFMWLFLLTFARALIRGNRRVIAACTLLFALVLTFLLGPMVLPRYYLFLFYLAPVLACALISGFPGSSKQDRVSSSERDRGMQGRRVPSHGPKSR